MADVMAHEPHGEGSILPAVQIWKADRSSVHVQKSWTPINTLKPSSIPIILRLDTGDESASLPLFASATVLATTTEDQEDIQHWLLDGVGYCGGRIWAMDWRPDFEIDAEPKLHTQFEYLALSTHTLGYEQNNVGQTIEGAGVAQIWSVSQTGDSGNEGALKMVMAILHEGAVAWDMKWCPNARIYAADQAVRKSDYNLLGILAMALGNGEVHIVCVPMPDEVELDQRDDTSDSLAVTIEPSVLLTQDDLSGSIVSSIDWLPSSPHDLLLLGFWDGFISIWQLPQGRRCQPQVLIYHRCEVLPIRRALWIKPPSQAQEPDDNFRYTFCTGGHSGVLSIWDMRNVFEPLFSRMLARVWLLDLATTSTPRHVYAALEDATMRFVTLEATKFLSGMENMVRTVSHNDGPIWSISCSEKLGLGAFGGEDGDISMFEVSSDTDSKKKKKHQLCAGSIKFVQEGLQILVATDITNSSPPRSANILYGLDSDKGKAKTRTNEAQWIQQVKFSPNGQGTVWLAVGTASGLVRVLRISN